MNHIEVWFLIARDIMWFILAIIPLFTFSDGIDSFDFTFGILTQIFWVSAAVNGWFK